MRAIVCKSFKTPFELSVEEKANPIARPDEVIIDTKAAGINFPDSLIVQGKYQIKPELPFIPGMEMSGVINAVGERVENLRLGMRVLAYPHLGAFAEKVVVSSHEVFPIPDSMSFVEAAGFVHAYGTSHHALKDRAQLKAGETLLVLGAAGGIGLAAVEIGKVMGAKVIAAASSAEKLELCKQHGADALIDYRRDDLRTRIKEITNGEGVDVVYDPVGGDYAEQSVRSLKRYGRYLILGFASGEIPKLPLNLLLLKTATAVGVFWSQFVENEPQHNNENVGELFRWYLAGKLRPHVSATFPFAETAAAITYVAERKALGKVVITFD
jgi:NADPH:quinone reductase